MHMQTRRKSDDPIRSFRFKTNIAPIENALDKISALNGVYYDWRRDEFKDKGFEDGRQIGVIAQDVEKVLPELVKTDSQGYKAVSYEKAHSSPDRGRKGTAKDDQRPQAGD